MQVVTRLQLETGLLLRSLDPVTILQTREMMITEVPCNSNLNHKPYINPITKPRPKARHLGDRGDAVRDVRELDSLLGGQIALAHIGSRVQQ